jgi:hypothetical protein
MRVTEIKNIPFLSLIPEEHKRWIGQEVEFEEPEPEEVQKDMPAIQDGELILYDRYGRIKKLKKMARLINII